MLFWFFTFSIKNIPFLGVCHITFCRLWVASFVKWQAITVGKKYGGLFLLPLDVAVGQLLNFRRESGEGIVSQVKQFEMDQLSDFGRKSRQVVLVESKNLEVLQLSDFRRKGSEVVLVEEKTVEIDELSDFRGKRGQVVRADTKDLEMD